MLPERDLKRNSEAKTQGHFFIGQNGSYTILSNCIISGLPLLKEPEFTPAECLVVYAFLRKAEALTENGRYPDKDIPFPLFLRMTVQVLPQRLCGAHSKKVKICSG